MPGGAWPLPIRLYREINSGAGTAGVVGDSESAGRISARRDKPGSRPTGAVQCLGDFHHRIPCSTAATCSWSTIGVPPSCSFGGQGLDLAPADEQGIRATAGAVVLLMDQQAAASAAQSEDVGLNVGAAAEDD